MIRNPIGTRTVVAAALCEALEGELRRKNRRQAKAVKALLRVGISRETISRYYGLPASFVAKVTRRWKREELPRLLRERRAISPSPALESPPSAHPSAPESRRE